MLQQRYNGFKTIKQQIKWILQKKVATGKKVVPAKKVAPEKTISHAMEWDKVASEVRRSACQMNYHVQYDGVCASMALTGIWTNSM